jgi:hypothetical protein
MATPTPVRTRSQDRPAAAEEGFSCADVLITMGFVCLLTVVVVTAFYYAFGMNFVAVRQSLSRSYLGEPDADQVPGGVLRFAADETTVRSATIAKALQEVPRMSCLNDLDDPDYVRCAALPVAPTAIECAAVGPAMANGRTRWRCRADAKAAGATRDPATNQPLLFVADAFIACELNPGAPRQPVAPASCSVQYLLRQQTPTSGWVMFPFVLGNLVLFVLGFAAAVGLLMLLTLGVELACARLETAWRSSGTKNATIRPPSVPPQRTTAPKEELSPIGACIVGSTPMPPPGSPPLPPPLPVKTE